jgi:predicted nucleic acid-binding protein
LALERPIILDTGPLVAFLVQSEPRHAWAVQQLKLAPAPLLTCEPVLTVAFHLLRRAPGGTERFFQLIGRGFASIDFHLMTHAEELEKLVRKYKDLPMSIADACLVRLAELHPSAAMLTLDGHFKIYRKHGRQPIPTIMPD